MIFKNPSGIFVEVEDKNEIEELLNTPRFREATPEEIKKFNNENIALSNEGTFTHIQYITHSNENNGYATSQKQLVDTFLTKGISLQRAYNGQKIGIAYGYPYLVEELRTQIKIIYTMFESTRIPKEWIPQLKKADLVLVPSKFCQKVFENFGVKSEVVSLGYDSSIFTERESNNSLDSDFYFIHYDALNNRKGWDIVFKAFNEEFEKDNNVKLIFKTTKEELPFPILKSQYPNIELIKGSVSHEELVSIIARADCGVFPSRGEGFGLTPLETLALGIPSIIPNAHGFSQFFTPAYFIETKIGKEIPALYEFFMGRDMGKMFEVDKDDLREKMRYVVENRKKIQEMGLLGAKWVKENFTIENTVNRLIKKLDKFNDVEAVPVQMNKAVEDDAIIFLTEDTQHITGGRYYSWWLATALRATGQRVIIYTNREPLFINEFSEYPQPEIRIENDLASLDVRGKIYVGSPIIGSEAALRLGKKYNRPTYIEVFDPFPMMEKYKGANNWHGWDDLIREMKCPEVNILSLCKATNPYIEKWLDKSKEKVIEVYPCLNNKARDKSKINYKKNWVTFISRLDFHKNVDHVLEAVKATDCELHVITSVDGIGFPEMVARHKMTDRVVVHFGATDEEKFEIIKKSRATINGATYEGFGMWLIESLSCGVPAVCYDFPTFREIQSVVDKEDDLVYFAEYNNIESLGETLKKALSYQGKTRGTRKFDFPEMVKRFTEVIDLEPKIGVITIALNEEEYIGASLRSMAKMKNVKKIAVVEGCVSLNESEANDSGLSKDETINSIVNVMLDDSEGKIVYDRYGWAKDKAELRNRALQLIGEGVDYIMVVDADEVWKEEDFTKLIEYIKEHPETTTIWYKALHFWKASNQIAVGGQWDEPLFRFFKYTDKSLKWNQHETPVENKDGISVTELGPEARLDYVKFYHYGPMKPKDKILAKLEYYKKRDIDLSVVDTWSNWKPGEPTQWTHGGGTAQEFTGEHPAEVTNLII
jgi:glycosyltransferase involved in cell wall biosynthesis